VGALRQQLHAREEAPVQSLSGNRSFMVQLMVLSGTQSYLNRAGNASRVGVCPVRRVACIPRSIHQSPELQGPVIRSRGQLLVIG